MFGKLMKHEFRATARTILPLYGIMLVLALMATMTMRLFDFNMRWQETVVDFIMITYGLSVFAVAVGVFILLMIRYKRNLLGDEGYLMMTLPTSVHGLLLSKLLTAMVWYLLTGVAVVLSVLIAGSDQFKDIAWKELMQDLRTFFTFLSRSELISAALRGAAAMLLVMSFVTLLFYADFSLAQSFRKHKVLYTVAAVVVILALFRLCGWITVTYHTSSGFASREVQVLTPLDYAQLIGLNLLTYFGAWWALSKRLNLE